MAIYVSICFLLLSSVLGASAISLGNLTNLVGLYVLDDNEKPVKLDLTETYDEPLIDIEHLPKFIDFHLYTRKTNDSEILKLGDADRLKSSHFDKKKATKFITHGWTNSHRSKACTLVRDAFLKNGDYNVIVVDWSLVSQTPYLWASSHVRRIAKVVASMINFLETQGASASNMTLVGHSLGAHIVGLSSYYAKSKVSYVVALDPAGPNFYQKRRGSMVTKEDAMYVQVIHTSGVLGLPKQLGHSDFYPNGGAIQTGCLVDMGGACSHALSYHYYAEAINSNRFLARSCNTYYEYLLGACKSNPVVSMGGLSPNLNARGPYFLITNWKAPFAMNSA